MVISWISNGYWWRSYVLLWHKRSGNSESLCVVWLLEIMVMMIWGEKKVVFNCGKN